MVICRCGQLSARPCVCLRFLPRFSSPVVPSRSRRDLGEISTISQSLEDETPRDALDAADAVRDLSGEAEDLTTSSDATSANTASIAAPACGLMSGLRPSCPSVFATWAAVVCRRPLR